MKKIFIGLLVLNFVFTFSFGNAQAVTEVANLDASANVVVLEDVSKNQTTETENISSMENEKTEEVSGVSTEMNNVVVNNQTTESVDSSKNLNKKIGIPLSPSDWVSVGNPGFSVGQAYYESLAIDSNNIPYVAYVDMANNGRVTVMKFNGTSWMNVGNPGFSLDSAVSLSLALNSNNIPYVAYSASEANQMKANVMKFDGTNWVSVGSPNFSVYISSFISLDFDSTNTPYVAYEDYGLGGKATVMKFNGTDWVPVGNPMGFSASNAAWTSLKIDSNNIPYVAYTDNISFNNFKATVMKFDGTNWIPVGIRGFSAGYADSTSLTIGSNNELYVAFRDGENNFGATVMKFDGTNWILVGTPGFSVNIINGLSSAIDSNNVSYVIYADAVNNNKATVMKFNGVNWVNVGTPGFSAGQAQHLSLAIDSNNISYVAYEDMENNNKATVMKYGNVNPSITITSPNGGENFIAGDQFTAIWTTTGIPATDEIYFGLIQDGTNLYYSLTGNTINDGTELFTIPANIIPGQYKMYARYANSSIDDFSDNSFTISSVIPSLTILTPNGGETFITGDQFTAKWTSGSFQPTDNLAFDLVSKATNIHYPLTTSTLNDGIENFTIPSNLLPGDYKLYGKFLSSPISDYSDDYFTLISQSISDWVNVGTPGFSAGQAESTFMAIDSNNIPYVVYSDWSNNLKAVVMKFDGTNWVSVGSSGFSGAGAYQTSLVFDSNNIPYVSYVNTSNYNKANVMKFDGTNWVYVGNPDFSVNEVYSLSFSLDSNNIPYVVFTDSSQNDKATVMKFDGINWVPVGTPGFSAGQAYGTKISIDSNNIIYITYADQLNNFKATTMKFNQTNWVLVGNAGYSNDSVNYISSAIDSNNVLHVAYQDNGYYGGHGTVMKWDGTSWVSVGGQGNIGEAGQNSFFSLAFDSNDVPYVAYRDAQGSTPLNGRVTVSKFDGTYWATLGNAQFSAGWAYYISLALDSNNIPYVAFQDEANDLKATVMKYPFIVPSLTITSPNGGETFSAGQQFTTTWTSTGFLPTDKMYFGLIQDGTNLYYSLTGETLNDGTEVFTIPANILPGQYRLHGRFSYTAIEDFSDSSFTIN